MDETSSQWCLQMFSLQDAHFDAVTFDIGFRTMKAWPRGVAENWDAATWFGLDGDENADIAVSWMLSLFVLVLVIYEKIFLFR